MLLHRAGPFHFRNRGDWVGGSPCWRFHPSRWFGYRLSRATWKHSPAIMGTAHRAAARFPAA